MLNTNISPYYDDYNPTADYHRILYKPGYAVQSRELNQMQSIQQQQISYFGSSIYSQNSPVVGGGVTVNLDCYYVKLNYRYSINNVDVSVFKNRVITNDGGDVQAQVLAVASGTGVEDGTGDQPTLIVSYLSGSRFTGGETVYTLVNGVKTPRATTYSPDEDTPCTGKSSTANVAEGTFFVMNGSNQVFDKNTNETMEYKTGTFVRVGKQTIILDKYSDKPSYRIGLDIEESFVTVEDDPSLYDPALESSNYEAPGADRYRIYLRLVTKSLDYGDDENFIELCKIEDGIVRKQVDSDIYSTLDDYFAKRTYDTNGDFIVSDFDIEPIAYKQEDWLNDNGEEDLDKKALLQSKYKLKIGKGLAYVRGYRIENQSEIILVNDRARMTDESKKFAYINYGNYVKVRNGVGNILQSSVTSVNLYAGNDGTNQIGTANIKGVLYSTTLGDSSHTQVFDLYLTDIKTASRSLTVTNLQNTEHNNKAALQVSASSTSGVFVGAKVTIGSINYVGTVAEVTSNTLVMYPSLITSASESSYQASISPSIFNVNSVGTGSSDYVVVDGSGKNSDGLTTLYESSNNDVIVGLGNTYAAEVSNVSYDKQDVFKDGSSPASSNYSNATNFINYSTSTVSLNVADSSIPQGSYSMAFVRNNYYNTSADPLMFLGYANITDESMPSTMSTVNTDGGNVVFVNNPPTGTESRGKFGMTVFKSSYVKTSTRKLCLFVPHVTSLRKVVRLSGDYSTDTSVNDMIRTGTDITSLFSLDSGQRDDYIDHGYIYTNTDVSGGDIVALYDCYVPTNNDSATSSGYYSISSYENAFGDAENDYPNIYDIQYVSSSGVTYNLTDSLDFRPRKSVGQTASITYTIYNRGIVHDDVPVSCLYRYYLGRYDILVLSKDGVFQIVQGAPSLNPKVPETPDGCLLIATIIHDPYTYYLPEEAPKGVRPNLRIVKNIARRWTMDDISGMSKRIDNIEYYTSLNLLEQTAQNMQITDSDGLNRFKNGILVDNFTSFFVADTGNKDFQASIDKVNGKLSMAYVVDNFALQDIYNTDSNITKKTINTTTNVYMLPYDKVTVTEQVLASNTVNVNPFGLTNYQGVLSINPPMDNWVDNKAEPDIYIVDDGVAFYTESDKLNVLNVTNWQTIPGTTKSSTVVTGKSSSTKTTTSNLVRGLADTVIETKTTTTKTTTKTTTTTEQSRQITTGYYSYAGDSYNMDNGFITDVSIQPYIRAQDLLVYADGMSTNTVVTTWFDGKNVDEYFKMADIIEMEYTSNSIRFNRGDIVGYQKKSGAVYPIGTVVGTYYDKSSGVSRLYVVSSYITNVVVNEDVKIVPIMKSGSTWSVTSTSTYGVITSGKIIADSYSGRVVSVGKDGTSSVSSKILYNQVIAENSVFLKRYGCFGNYNGSSVSAFSHTFRFKPTKTQPLYPCFQTTLKGSSIRVYSGTSTSGTPLKEYVLSLTSAYTTSDNSEAINVTAGSTYTIVVETPSTTSDTVNNQIGMALSDSPWTLSATTTGNIVWSTRTPIAVESKNFNLWSTNTYVDGGGIVYTGVTQICVGSSQKSSENASYYSGAKIVIYSYNVNTKGEIYKMASQTSTVNSFDSATGVVTLTSPVTVSFGYNNVRNVDVTSTYMIRGSISYKLSSRSVSGISTNEDGVIAGIFSIPANTFKTGERKFRIDNRTTENDPDSATTYSEGVFTASGLSTKSQSLSFSASVDSMTNTSTRTEKKSTTKVTYNTALTDVSVSARTVRIRANRDPLAQTFMVNADEFPEGVFLSGIKVFFQSKPSDVSTPISLRIVTTDTGYPTQTELDNSLVVLKASDVNVSQNPEYDNSETFTLFEFQTPVYIQPDILYAFILKSDSTDYNVWIARQNAIALRSTVGTTDEDTVTKIGSVPYVGNIFESQNASTWVADPTASMMFVVERCKFRINNAPTVTFGIPEGNPQRKSLDNNSMSFYTTYIENGDFESDALNFTTTEFVPTGTRISYSYTGTSATSKTTSQINPGNYGCPTYENLDLDDGYGPRYIRTDDSDSLTVSATLSSTNDAISPMLSDDGLSVYSVRYIKGEGSDYAKGVYVTQKATLASGNTSEDIMVYLTAYRPYGTGIKVFVKLLSPNDNSQFDENDWVELEELGEAKNYSVSKDDIFELNFSYGINGKPYGSISYTSSDGNVYSNFNQFAIRIEMTTNDNTKVPEISSMIAIALPSGN